MSDRQHTLAADIGGTHARFLLSDHFPVSEHDPHGGIKPWYLDLAVADYSGIDDLLQDVLTRLAVTETTSLCAAFAVAGPVRHGRAALTNLPWSVGADALRKRFGFRDAIVLNDLAAAASALAERPTPDATMLQRGDTQADGRHLLVSVGTGLGTAYWSRAQHGIHVEPAEAGHAGFSAGETWEIEWLQELQRIYGERVSWERAVSGPGLASLDAFMRGGEKGLPPQVARRAATGDTIALTVLKRFAWLLGAFTGDLVLAAPARGGVWLTGGVLAGLGPFFDTQAFMHGFSAKRRLGPVLEEVPVRWTVNGELGLRGAWLAAHALHQDP